MEWFQKSELKEDGFADYYVWRPPANANFNETGELPEPPNAWVRLVQWSPLNRSQFFLFGKDLAQGTFPIV